MYIKREKEHVLEVETLYGEKIYPIIGETEGAKHHSIAKVVIPYRGHSMLHYHPESTEEIYYILQGKGSIKLDGNLFIVGKGDTILISPNDIHEITSIDEQEDLIFIVTCSPIWSAENTVFVEAE